MDKYKIELTAEQVCAVYDLAEFAMSEINRQSALAGIDTPPASFNLASSLQDVVDEAMEEVALQIDSTTMPELTKLTKKLRGMA